MPLPKISAEAYNRFHDRMNEGFTAEDAFNSMHEDLNGHLMMFLKEYVDALGLHEQEQKNIYMKGFIHCYEMLKEASKG